MACSKCSKNSNITYKGEDYCWDHFDEVSRGSVPETKEELNIPDDFYPDDYMGGYIQRWTTYGLPFNFSLDGFMVVCDETKGLI